jgi:hypothetical protein
LIFIVCTDEVVDFKDDTLFDMKLKDVSLTVSLICVNMAVDELAPIYTMGQKKIVQDCMGLQQIEFEKHKGILDTQTGQVEFYGLIFKNINIAVDFLKHVTPGNYIGIIVDNQIFLEEQV